MLVVALVGLAPGSAIDVEAAALAPVFALPLYETALVLRTASPSVLLRTADKERAIEVLGALRARGHEAVACDEEAIVSSETMPLVRGFALETDAFVALEGGVETATIAGRVAYGDVIALLRATHRARTSKTEKTKERSLSLGRAVLTGGLLLTKTTTKESIRTADEQEQVLYLFHAGGPPWLVRATKARYDGLGDARRAASLENFLTLTAALRERAPAGAYDERLLQTKAAPEATDLLAHVLALALHRRHRR